MADPWSRSDNVVGLRGGLGGAWRIEVSALAALLGLAGLLIAPASAELTGAQKMYAISV